MKVMVNIVTGSGEIWKLNIWKKYIFVLYRAILYHTERFDLIFACFSFENVGDFLILIDEHFLQTFQINR